MRIFQIYILFLLIISMLSVSSFARATKNQNSCTAIDLRSEVLGKVRNQGNAGWCFAYTIADLVSQKTGVKISALDLSINFYQEMPEMPRDAFLSEASGGSDLGAVSYSRKGYCSEELLPSENYGTLKNCRSDIFEPNGMFKELETNNVDYESLTVCQREILSRLFTGLNPLQISKIYNQAGLSVFQKIYQLKDLNCQGKRISAKGIDLRGTLKSGSEVIKDLDFVLNKGQIVSLNYDAGFMVEGAVNGTVYNHYSSVVARRYNEESRSCQYLIRNSWGENCAVYPERLRKNCDSGNLWVDKETLMRSLINIHYLRDKK